MEGYPATCNQLLGYENIRSGTDKAENQAVSD
jgi:hypothetical protein